MGQIIDAKKALEYGLVNEVVKREELMDRAWAIARQLLRQRPMILRHTRLLFTHDLRRRMLDMVGYGLALEGLDVADAHDRAPHAAGPDH
jgi:enoyl-CoA hydratase/carnithine racemase